MASGGEGWRIVIVELRLVILGSDVRKRQAMAASQADSQKSDDDTALGHQFASFLIEVFFPER